MKKKIVPFFIKIQCVIFFVIFVISCNSPQPSQSIVEIQETIEYPVGYIAKQLTIDMYDSKDLYPLPYEFLENFMQVHTQYEGTHPTLASNFPEEWGVVIVERLPEGRELYQIQSKNREWVFLVITSGYGTQRILDILPVAINLAHQTQEVLETEIWNTDREIDGTFVVTKKYEWVHSVENVTQQEYESNPLNYLRTQTITDKYFINDFCRFEKITSENIPDYAAVIFYYKDEKSEDEDENVSMLQAFCEDHSILYTEVRENFNQIELRDYKLNYITTVDISHFSDLSEGIVFIKKGEIPKTVPIGSFERMKIEIIRYFKI